MASTTTDPVWIAGSAAEAARDCSETSGFDVLDDLVCMTRVPADPSAERRALRSLALLLSRTELPAEAVQPSARLRDHLGRLSITQVEAILDWLTPRRSWWQVHRVPALRRMARVRLLFVVTVAVGAHAYRHEALVVLVQRGLLGDAERVQRQMDWMCSRVKLPGERELARTYLDLVRDSRAGGNDELVGEDRTRTFRGWPWTRQLLLLERSNHAWNVTRGLGKGSEDPGPAVVVGEMEFDLARARAYSRLARRGGAIARTSLRAMGYRDFRVRRRTWPVRPLLLATGLCLLAALLTIGAYARARRWDSRSDVVIQWLEWHLREDGGVTNAAGGRS